jgi:alkanesulfonate monooxygenase SsuD/methylene tetrahydromethanopterin reductase-like flavin-dependent oxidoreductase (luciferase family)
LALYQGGGDGMAGGLRFGICTDQNMDWPTTVERWQLYEALGFDSVWDCDHFVQPSRPQGPYFEGWTLLAALAARTERIRIGVLVSCNTFRHPAIVVKEAVTIDHISKGRLEVGLGAGWYEPEHEMLGIEFPGPAELVDRFREAVEITDAMLRNEVTSYAGRYYQLKDAAVRPRPLQQPRPPLTLGAKKSKMLRIVAEYANAWNAFGTPEEMRQRNEILNEHCAAIGRNPAEIWRGVYYWLARQQTNPWDSVDAFHDVVGRYREAGINEFIIDQPPAEQLPMLERIASEVIPQLRAG